MSVQIYLEKPQNSNNMFSMSHIVSLSPVKKYELKLIDSVPSYLTGDSNFFSHFLYAMYDLNPRFVQAKL